MNHDIHQEPRYNFYNFLPLAIILTCITAFTILMRVYAGDWNLKDSLLDFMAGFFLVFGFFKVINLAGFAQAYSTYDIIAQRSIVYAYSYPFIEITLGILYLFRYNLFLANLVTLFIMGIGSIGVIIELRKKREIVCACLGTVFKIPMTYVTLAEDLIMGLMALFMMVVL